MDAGLTALLAATVGVIGTLVSPILAQRSVARHSHLTAARDRELRNEERETAQRRTTFEERRTEYTALNALARTCRNEIKACARGYSEASSAYAEELAAVRNAWLAYQDRYDTAQMILPDEVLSLASRVNRLLANGYRQAQMLASPAAPKPEAIVEFCDGLVLDKITELRRAMRADLGVGDPLPTSLAKPSDPAEQ
jgi:hypothetical protein